LTLDFVKGASEYKGKLSAKFHYKKANDAEVFLDAITKAVHKLEVNNKEVTVDSTSVKDNRIYLPKNLLQESNDVVIRYLHIFSPKKISLKII
jgi:hypothetical protein